MSSALRAVNRRARNQAPKNGVLKVALKQLIESAGQSGPLAALLGQLIPIRASHEIGKIVTAVNAELEQYEKSRITLCERYARKDAKGKAIQLDQKGKPLPEGEEGTYDIPVDKQAQFNKEHEDLTLLEVEIPGRRVHINDLDGARLLPAHSMKLNWLLTDGTDQEAAQPGS